MVKFQSHSEVETSGVEGRLAKFDQIQKICDIFILAQSFICALLHSVPKGQRRQSNNPHAVSGIFFTDRV